MAFSNLLNRQNTPHDFSFILSKLTNLYKNIKRTVSAGFVVYPVLEPSGCFSEPFSIYLFGSSDPTNNGREISEPDVFISKCRK
jgi:hypothetical protein